jgi:hypothetical protein
MTMLRPCTRRRASLKGSRYFDIPHLLLVRNDNCYFRSAKETASFSVSSRLVAIYLVEAQRLQWSLHAR